MLTNNVRETPKVIITLDVGTNEYRIFLWVEIPFLVITKIKSFLCNTSMWLEGLVVPSWNEADVTQNTMGTLTKAYEALLAQYSDMITEAARMVGGTDPLVERLKSNILKLNQLIYSDMNEFEKTKSEYNRFTNTIKSHSGRL